MNLNEVKALARSKAYKTQFMLKQHSPEIFLVAGIGGSIVSTVLACVVTYKKLRPIVEDAEERMEYAQQMVDFSTEQDFIKAKTLLGLTFFGELVKVYGPSAVIAILSYGMLVSSNRILSKRNAAIVSAYAIVDTAFKQYRKRVQDELGNDVDEYLRWKKPLEEKMKVVPADRKVKAIEFDDLDFADLPGELADGEDQMGMPSQYARIFDNSSVYWRRDKGMNDFFLSTVQSQLNDKLRAQGHLFLNEAYDTLGLPRSEAGAVVGWVADGDGDQFVDMDVFNPRNELNRDYVNGYQEDAVVLDFNVDGIILSILA